MQSSVQIFDEWLVLAQMRRRFYPIPNDVSPPFRDQLSVFEHRLIEIRKQFLPGRSIEVYVDFVDDGTCNAAAGIHKYTGLIGINKGMILLPLDLFWRMFSHPEIAKDIGNRQLERRSAQHDDGLPEDYDALSARRARAGRSIHPKPPECPIRRRMAQVCMDLVWRFLAMHELVHIMHGHVDYVQQTHSLPFILESTQSTTPPVSRYDLDRQSIELWADAVATSVVLRGFLNKSPLVGIYAGLQKPSDRLFLWGYAIYTLFRLWGFRFDPKAMQSCTHPPSVVRFAMVIVGATYDALEGHPELRAQYLTIIKAAQVAAERGIAYCGGDRVCSEDLELLRDPQVIAHRDRLAAHFDDVLAPELKKIAYVQLFELGSQNGRPEYSS